MSAPLPPVAWRRVPRGPVATVLLSAVALLVAAWPGLAEAAQLDRAAVASEPWRVLTGHLSHFTPAHLAYDLAVLVVLGWICESRWPGRARATLAAALLACSAAFLLGAPELATYRGLSGLDSGLFALFAARLHVERAFPGGWMRHLPALGLLGLAAKVAYEVRSDAATFAGASELFVPVPIAHVAGAAVGLLLGLARQLPQRPTLVSRRQIRVGSLPRHRPHGRDHASECSS